MMGVYIKGMTKKQAESCFKFAMDGWCIDEMPEIIELPPHGRLIDVDTLITVTEMVNGEFKTYIEVFEVADAPTIIEAEQPKYADNK